MTRTLLYMCGAGLHHLRAAAGVAGRSAKSERLHRRASARAAAQTQTIGQGPVASQEAIKMLGTNGGGFFNANSAHPYENPTPFSNFLQILSIFIIPAGSPTRWAA
jgi:K+-transporting ATPase A subunit